MKRAVFATTFLDSDLEILGADGEVYVLKPFSTIVLPFLNAVALEKANIGKIIGEYSPQQTDPQLIGNHDLIKEWAEQALQMELSKPPQQRNPDRIIELKMLINGMNPEAFLKESPRINKSEQIKIPQKATHSSQPSPTGLCSPYNTAQVGNLCENEYKEENKSDDFGLKDVFELFGLRCTVTLQAYRINGLNDVIDGFSILDYGYTRAELHPELKKLLRTFGFDDKDFYVTMLFDEYECPKHGKVYKAVVDWEKRYIEGDGERRKYLKLHVGRIHPLKKYGDSKRYSNQKLEQIKLITQAVRKKGIVGYREFDGEIKEVRHFESDIALMWLVFTVPERISRGLRNYILARPEDRGKVEELMRKSTRGALEKFMRKYLKKHENINLTGKFRMGGMMNVHLWSSSNPLSPHMHNHVCIFNFIEWNGKIVRFSPYLGKNWLDELRKAWRDEFFRLIEKDRYHEMKVWIDPFVEEDYQLFNVYNAYTWVDECNEGRIIHHLRYNSRKAIVDLNEFFYNGIRAEEVKEKEWLKYLVNYSNRTSNFGFMNNWRQIFGISKDEALEAIERARKEHYEYCPVCKSRLEYLRTVTVDQVAENKRLLVLWYFDRRMHVEVWRATDVMRHQSGRGYYIATQPSCCDTIQSHKI
ncbi:hypothetical protein [Archaeoglobus sp.]